MFAILPPAMLAFMVTTGVLCLGIVLLGSRRRRDEERLHELRASDLLPPNPADGIPAAPPGGMSDLVLSTLPKIGTPLLPSEEGLTQLENRLRKAGYYQRHAPALYLGARAVIMGLTVMAAVMVGASGVLSPAGALVFGGMLAGVAAIAPGLWLDAKTRERQDTFRRSLPDALDVMVICVEGGLSVPEAIRRVSAELQTAHTLLASEMRVVQKEILLGLSPGEAIRRFAGRCDLDEVRSLATVLLQSERFGASTAKALRTQADQLRQRRHQRAEERAQRAAVLILFPTLLCIFPAVFLVFLGPAVFRILDMFSRIR